VFHKLPQLLGKALRVIVCLKLARGLLELVAPTLSFAVNFLSLVVVMAAAVTIRMLFSRLFGASQVIYTAAHAAAAPAST
jgi:hypothetical protein